MIETLRPNAPGDETRITSQYPVTGEHWDKVAEAEADEDSTYLREPVGNFYRDLFNLPASSGYGTINFIKIYFRCRVIGPSYMGYAKATLKSDGTVKDGPTAYPSKGAPWITYSHQWNVNPADSEAWEWADIDALQIGVVLRGTQGYYETQCTQVYAEVDYTPEEPPVVPPKLEGWLPMPLNMGPPLPRFLQIFWPFYKG